MSENTNLPSGGSENANLSDINNPENLNWDDETEEAQSNDEQDSEGTDPDEAEDGAASDTGEPDESEDAPEDETEEEQPDEAKAADVELPDDALITLKNGEKVKFGDLKAAPMLEADYRRKTQVLAQKVRETGEQASRTHAILNEFANELAQNAPPKPDISLLTVNPYEYHLQLALYQQFSEKLQSIVSRAEQVKDVKNNLNEQQRKAIQEDEIGKLVERMPEIAEPKKAREFAEKFLETGNQFGFTKAELDTLDHRILIAMHYARLGLEAEKAKASVAKKTITAKPVAPIRKATKPGGDRTFVQNKDAMRRLTKSGSIHDAVKIDWD